MTFGQRLRELRQAKNLTQRDVAAIVNVSHTYLSKLESGKADGLPSRRLVVGLGRALDAQGDELNLLAGRIPEDVLAYLRGNPTAIEAVRTMMKEPHQVAVPLLADDRLLSERLARYLGEM